MRCVTLLFLATLAYGCAAGAGRGDVSGSRRCQVARPAEGFWPDYSAAPAHCGMAIVRGQLLFLAKQYAELAGVESVPYGYYKSAGPTIVDYSSDNGEGLRLYVWMDIPDYTKGNSPGEPPEGLDAYHVGSGPTRVRVLVRVVSANGALVGAIRERLTCVATLDEDRMRELCPAK